MNWISLDSLEQLKVIKETSENQRVLLLMFSPGNSVNFVVKFLLEREWNEDEMKMKTYIFDLVGSEELSGEIEKEFGAVKESPQVLIIERGKPVFNASYGRILFSELRKFSN
ncbi:MAG: monothiol bacilliredoxin BrxC family protein [Ignavibacteria bacterium]